MSTQVKTGASRPGTSAYWVASTAAVSALRAERLAGVDARHARQLPRRLRDAVVGIDAAAEVDDAEEQEQERDEHERHLRDALTRLTLPDGADPARPRRSRHGVTVTVRVYGADVPARLVTTSEMVYVPCV